MRRKNQKQQILLPQDPTVCQTITPGPYPRPAFQPPKGGVLTRPGNTRTNLFIDIPPMSTRRRTYAFAAGFTPGNRASNTVEEHNTFQVLLRKEVIQPHLPVRLPCYDLVPIAGPTFDGSLPQGVRPPASGVTNFRDLTGGVYKARERIHRSVADLRLLATPTS